MEHNSMEAHPLWDLGLNGTGVIVGVADSGIELDHGCFRHNENLDWRDWNEPSKSGVG